jgi:hypothetical protein
MMAGLNLPTFLKGADDTAVKIITDEDKKE